MKIWALAQQKKAKNEHAKLPGTFHEYGCPILSYLANAFRSCLIWQGWAALYVKCRRA
jgi:hypothetical protein